MAEPGLVILNPAAHRGTSVPRYARVREAVAAAVRGPTVLTDPEGAWRRAVAEAFEAGARLFVAAGGDGTVHALVNALAACAGDRLPEVVLGAVGLGSSNDFHKPARRVVAGVPLRLDVARAARRDLIRVRYGPADGRDRTRWVVVSASLGATARANARFDGDDALARHLKRAWTDLAILVAALRTIAAHANTEARLRWEGHEREVALTNLSVVKTRHLSGALRYDAPVAPDDGLLTCHLCEGMSRRALAVTVARLARGRFLGRPGTATWRAPWLEVRLAGSGPLELDGELTSASRVRFDAVPGGVRVCGA